MSAVFRIYDKRPGSNRWVREESDRSGNFLYQAELAAAQVFSTLAEAGHAIDRWVATHPWYKVPGGSFHPFEIRASREIEPQSTYLLVGGPLDGQRYYIDGNEFIAQRPMGILLGAWPAPGAVLPIEQLVYLKHELQAGTDLQRQRHIVFVFAGVRGKRPIQAEYVLFRDRNYRIELIEYDGKVTITALRIELGWKRALTINEKDLTYDFAMSVWTPRDGATVEMLDTVSTTAP